MRASSRPNSQVPPAPPKPFAVTRLPALLVGVLLLGSLLQPAQAQEISSSSSCTTANLLAGKKPVAWQDIRGDRLLVTDGNVAPEGALWNAPLAAILDTGAATLTYDLGTVTPIQAFYIQADANDVYQVWGSLDGRDFRSLGRIEAVEGHGLRFRKLAVGGMAVRFVRFGEGVGDNAYSVSEIQAYCQLPNPFPPKLNVVSAPASNVPKNIYTYWNNESSAGWELVLAVLGLLLLNAGVQLEREGRPQKYRRLRDRALMALGALSLLTYFNFGFFHFGNAIHDWEWTHYYVGSKYFKELSYDRLYECIAIADSETPGLRRRVELRKLTNLRTNALETTAEILANPESCKQHFTAERWQAFKQDVKFFRDRQSARRWDDLQTDHGYNGTPVWNIAGTLLSNLAPASVGQLYALAALDPLYLLAAVGLILWAFGWPVTCVALMVFATNFPSRFYWTGGAFLRWDWIFYLIASVCCLKKDKPLLAGLALGYSTLLRVFPMFVFLGPLLAAGYHFYKHRKLDPRYVRFFAGGALAAALLIPLSLPVGGGVESYRQFVRNTAKHKETPLTNYMGLRTVMAYRPSETGEKMRDERKTDPWKSWKVARIRAFKNAKPLYALVTLGFVVLLGFAVRNRPPWQAAALGTTFIAVGVELTCYYYAFILALALLYEADEKVGRWLLGLTAFTGIVNFHPLPGMPSWLDEQYTLMSAGTLVAFAIILWRFGLAEWWAVRFPPRVAAVATAGGTEAAKVSATSESPSPSSSPAAKTKTKTKPAGSSGGERRARRRRRK